MKQITHEIAAKVLETVDAGLMAGLGRPTPGEMCVEAAVCYALGLPHGDDPDCVSPALQVLMITLNDMGWSSPEARAQGLRRLALAQLGSMGRLDNREFARRVAEMAVSYMVPIALRAAAAVQPYPESLCDAADRCEEKGTDAVAAANAAIMAVASRADPAGGVVANAAAAAANAAAAAYAATYNSAVAAVTYAAYAAGAAASAYAAADDASRDAILADFAECVVEILIEMDAPGAQWLDLAPAA